MYIKITLFNGFCGCDEEFYEEVENAEEADELAEEYLENYTFADPDDRFCDMEDEEAIEEYYENICFDWGEISKEDYEENKVVN